MNGFETLLLSYFLNSIWQVPLVLLATAIGTRLIRQAGPWVEHRLWAGALVCEALLPAISLVPWRLHIAWPWVVNPAPVHDAGISVEFGAGVGAGSLRLPPLFLAAMAVGYLAAILYFSVRFAWRCARVSGLARSTKLLNLTGDAQASWNQWIRRFGLGPVLIASSSQIFAPLTVGIFRKRVLLPADMLKRLSRADLDTAIVHELAHIRRNDFLKNLFYELLSLPVNYHPGFWFTRQQMMETREMVCDQIASEDLGGHAYAESLLRLASMLLQGGPVRVPPALGVFDANTLERRLMKLTENRKQIGRLRRCVSVCVCIALGVATASSAFAWRLGVEPGAGVDSRPAQKTAPHSVPPDKMVEHLLTKVNPKYPPAAKKARIQGTVVLDAIIGKTGLVENLKVVSGPEELQASALDAVRQWTYKPVLLNGVPIEVETTIKVNYTLAK